MNQTTVQHIAHGRAWKHIRRDEAPATTKAHVTRDAAIVRGEQNPNHVLTEAEVREIIDALTQPDVSKRALAREYGVSSKTIWNLAHGRAWKHVARAKTRSSAPSDSTSSSAERAEPSGKV